MYSFVPVNSGAVTQESAYTYTPVQNNPVAYAQQMCGPNAPVRMIYVSAPPVAPDSAPMVYWNNNTNVAIQSLHQQNQQMFLQPVQNNQKPSQQLPQVQYVQIIPSSFHPNQTIQPNPQYATSPHQMQPVSLDGSLLQAAGQQFSNQPQRMENTVPSFFYVQPQQIPVHKLNQVSQKTSERHINQPTFIQKSQQQHSSSQKLGVTNNNGGASKKIIRPPSTTWGFMLLDPINKVNPILNVHFDFVYPTAATESYYTDAHQGSLNYRMHHKVCPRFTGGDEDSESGCPMGKQCQYMHIHPAFLRATRCVTQPLCCAEHNCYFTRHTLQKAQKTPASEQRSRESESPEDPETEEMPFLSPATVLTVWSHGRCIGSILPNKLSLTVACRRLETCPHIDLDRAACRLYQQGRCRWGKECAHFHLCRELYAQWVDSKVLQLTMECMPELVVTNAPSNTEQVKHDADAQELIITEMLNGLSIGQKSHESAFDPMVSPCTPSIATPTTRSPVMGSIELGDVVLSQENTKYHVSKGFELSEHDFTLGYLLKDTADDILPESEHNAKGFVNAHTWKLSADNNMHSQPQTGYAMFSSDLVSSSHAPIFTSPQFITPSCLDQWKMN